MPGLYTVECSETVEFVYLWKYRVLYINKTIRVPVPYMLIYIVIEQLAAAQTPK
jgi:hypothetical protein